MDAVDGMGFGMLVLLEKADAIRGPGELVVVLLLVCSCFPEDEALVTGEVFADVDLLVVLFFCILVVCRGDGHGSGVDAESFSLL